jgi:ubiquitin thioesterase protein OTUB1
MAEDSSKLEINHEKFKQTENQLEEIASQIRKEQPLASDLLELESLRKIYDAGSNFDRGVAILSNDYKNIRTIRGDGNCYYRAFLYSLCEKLWQSEKEEQTRLKTFG